MLIEINRDSFLEGLSRAVLVTEKRTPLPILSHALLAVDEKGLVITATDLEVGLKMTLDCEVKEPGIVAIPARKTYEIVRELAPVPVTIQSFENFRIKITAGDSDFELPGMEASDYPAWPALEEVNTAVVQADKLGFAVEKTLFAASVDDSRFNLNGVLFERNEDKTRLVATDGHRLALMDEDLGISLDTRIIGPKKGLMELKRVLEGLKGEIRLGFEKKNLFVQTDRLIMTVRLIDGDYPDYKRVIPQTGFNLVRANRLAMLQTLRRVGVLTSERNKGVEITVKPGKMEITATHPDLGNARDILDIEYDGKSFSIIVNVSYVTEGLGVIESEFVTIEFYGEGAPVILRPEPVQDYFNLVMPMRR